MCKVLTALSDLTRSPRRLPSTPTLRTILDWTLWMSWRYVILLVGLCVIRSLAVDCVFGDWFTEIVEPLLSPGYVPQRR